MCLVGNGDYFGFDHEEGWLEREFVPDQDIEVVLVNGPFQLGVGDGRLIYF